MPNLTNQENANRNYCVIYSYLQNGYYIYKKKTTSIGNVVENPCTLLVEIQNGVSTVDNIVEDPQNIKSRTTVLSNYCNIDIKMSKNISSLVFTGALFIIATMWK